VRPAVPDGRGSPDLDKGHRFYREALDLADELAMRPLVAHCHLGLGKLYRRTGSRELAQEHLTIATTMYREMEMWFWLEQAEAEMRGAAMSRRAFALGVGLTLLAGPLALERAPVHHAALAGTGRTLGAP
jgi:hypothetical protein